MSAGSGGSRWFVRIIALPAKSAKHKHFAGSQTALDEPSLPSRFLPVFSPPEFALLRTAKAGILPAQHKGKNKSGTRTS